MAFIDKLLEGGLPYGMEIEQPKSHDKINRLIVDNDVQSIVQGLVMGTMGGDGKAARQLVLALKGKIKGGKMIPSQPIRQGIIGGPKKEIPKYTEATNTMMKEDLGTIGGIFAPFITRQFEKERNWGEKLAEMLLPDPVEKYPVEGNLKDMIEYNAILKNREKTKDSTII
tara:strand:+ start:15 stop:524 length:510 start_codon:yes stop_codon:yes gene_type:complete